MAVAKRQGRGKPEKIEQRKVLDECGPQVEQTALLSSPVYIRQARGRKETYKKRNQRAWVGLSRVCMLSLMRSLPPSLTLLSVSFGSACPHASRMYFLFIF